MASANTLLKNILNVKHTVITGYDFYTDQNGVNHLTIQARPDRRHENVCPICHKKCPTYDVQSSHPRTWRGLD